MSDQNQPPLMQEEELQQEDIKRLVLQYLRYWKWFILGIFIAVILAFLYVRFTPNVYNTDAEIKILEEKSSGIDLSGLSDAGSFLDVKKVNLENEIEVLKSRRLLDSVVYLLNLNTTYYQEQDFSTIEVWKEDIPFKVQWLRIDSVLTPEEELPIFGLDFSSTTKFSVDINDGEITKQATLNDTIEIDEYKFIVALNPSFEDDYNILTEDYYQFKHVSTESAINSLIKQLSVKPVGEDSQILNLALKGPNSHKNEAIINTLIKQFNKDGVRDKRLIARRTKDFVEERLVSLVEELDTVEISLVNYKQSSGVTTIESTAQQLFGKEATSESKRFELQTQREVAKSFMQLLKKEKNYSLLPANLGLESESINNLTGQYNETVLLRNELLASSATQKNPLIVNLEAKLDNILHNIFQSVEAYVESLNLSLKNFKARESDFSGKLHAIPAKTRQIRAIKRQQELKEKLYLFLLQKREEAALKYATTPPSIKVVDYAYTDPAPVAPKKKIILLAAIILGALVPFGFIYLKFLFDTKIHSKDQIEERLPDIPVLGEIPEIADGQQKLITRNDHSVLAESFRILRTNLSFFMPKKKGEPEVLFVTSTTKGEGKTFVALNIANTLALTGQKTLVIGCDLRNPQTHNYFNLNKNHIGVSSYLHDDSVKFADLPFKAVGGFDNLDLILAGQIPPNPAELIMSDRFEQLLEEAKQYYDVIIVDTAPTILVTDTLLISKYADATLYMARAGVTDTRLLDHIKKLHQTKKLNRMSIVFNGVNAKSGYGYSYNYGYGYGYSESTPLHPWWKFWKK